jgi:hypothetical protein
MSGRRELEQLAVLGQLILDARLSALRAAALAREQSLARLADLARPQPAAGLPPMAAEAVRLRYELWADQHRAEINRTLAQQTVAWTEARDAARAAFGRTEALRALQARLPKPKSD